MTAPSENNAAERKFPESAVFYRDLERTYRTAKRAAGAWIEADDGGRWLDACGGALTISVGHGRREVVQAAADQLADLAYVHGAQFTTTAMEQAAALLVGSLSAGLPKRQGLPHSGRRGSRGDRDQAGARPRAGDAATPSATGSSRSGPATTATPSGRSRFRDGIRSGPPTSRC